MPRLFATLAAFVVIAANVAFAQVDSAVAEVLYRLGPKAALSDGCGGQSGPLIGTFEMVPQPVGTANVIEFAVNDALFLIEKNAGDVFVRANGVYKITKLPAGATQRMTLNVTLDGGTPRSFDSGDVPFGPVANAAGIVITLKETNPACTVGSTISVIAGPVPKTDIQSHSLVMSTYKEFCVPPCMCPFVLSGPVVGSFDLVRLNPTNTSPKVGGKFAVRHVGWKIGSATTPTSSGVIGDGFYLRAFVALSNTGAVHRMQLDLAFNNMASERFDSGWQKPKPVASVASIAITIKNVLVTCKEKVFDLIAVP